jgi:C4-dicarboxylate transporter, DctM subunit
LEPILIGIFSGILLGILLLVGVPVAFSLGFSGIISIIMLRGWEPLIFLLGTFPFSTTAVFTYVVLPLFVLMGHLALASGIAEKAYYVSHKVLSGIPGGQAMASVFGCAAFAAVSGTSVGTAAAMGKIAIPEMRRYGYSPGFAAGCLASAGTLGILIPPSGMMVLYSIITEVHLGPLLIAGFLPGFLTAGIYSIGIYFMVKYKPSLFGGKVSTYFPWKERLISLKDGWGIIVLFLIVIGGIYSGIFTATEASAFGCFAALLILLITKGNRKKAIIEGLREASDTTAMVFIIILCAGFFSLALAQSRIPSEVANYVIKLELPIWAMTFILLIPYLILGCLIDGVSMLLLVTPIVFPIVKALNMDPIWFGILVIKTIEIGCITPPVGLNVFVISGLCPDIPMEAIFKGCVPFLIMELIVMILLILFPSIALFLPNQMQ